MWNIREFGTTRLLLPGCARRRAGTPARGGIIPTFSRRSIPPAAIVLAVGSLLGAMPAQAIEFGEGEFQGSLDTTISHGLTYRVGKRDPLLATKTNSNDGNLNYDRGVVSNTSKFTTDLDIGTGDFGAFVRASGFIDFENQNGDRARTPLSEDAKDRVGRNLELLDAYVTATFDVGDTIVDARLGRHVLNWGESTFIPNGINAINPFDVSKLRLPGSELREALLPVGLASLSVAPTDTLSVEGFYQFDWEETEIDAVGSYFSSTDYVGPGAREAVIADIAEGFAESVTEADRRSGFGPLTPAINADLAGNVVVHPQLGTVPMPLSRLASPDPDFASVLRGPDRSPDDAGQWGVALRYLAEDLNDTEFGFYFMNYHSRLPIVGARTSSPEAVRNALAAANAVSAPGSQTRRAIRHTIAETIRTAVMGAVELGLIDRAHAEAAIASRIEDEIEQGAVDEAVGGIASALAIDRYPDRSNRTGEYFLEYPEDIGLLGVSFNTVLGTSGWALQGEYSLRPDAPLQKAERTVLTEGLLPIFRGLRLAGAAAAAAAVATANPNPQSLADAQDARDDYLKFRDNYTPRTVQGYVERDVSQIQATATRVFGPTLGADGLVFLTEVALMHVHGMPPGKGVRVEDLAPGDIPLESPAGGVTGARAPDGADYPDADATSWGYRIAARLDYSNAIGAVNLFPYAQFLHDVSGNSPAPSGPFVEGRTAVTLGLRADYLSRWQADFGYTRYAGDGNDLSDRDFISASVKYSF